jgi:hypothetical protein
MADVVIEVGQNESFIGYIHGPGNASDDSNVIPADAGIQCFCNNGTGFRLALCASGMTRGCMSNPEFRVDFVLL